MTIDDETSVARAVEALRKAMLAADRAALSDLAADELIYGHTSGRTENKSQFIDGIVSGKSAFSEIELSDQTVRVVDNIALVHHIMNGARSNAPAGVKIKLAILSVWLRRHGQWKLVARQAVK